MKPLASIRDLGIIGDRRTGALITRDASIVWYCSGRFDRASTFASLLDSRAGIWAIELPQSRPAGRGYVGDSGILETTLETDRGKLLVTDWMPIVCSSPVGAICRILSPAPSRMRVHLELRPDFGRERHALSLTGNAVRIGPTMMLYASHAIRSDSNLGDASFVVPPGESSWAVLADQPIEGLDETMLQTWRTATLESWVELSERVRYSGPYEREIAASLRALRLMTFEETGGVIAALTTSLPETLGGARNYDYRYVWTRDAGMVVSALTRAGSAGIDERRFLDFICSASGNLASMPIGPVSAVDCGTIPAEMEIDGLAGYKNSRPVRIGNGAGNQLQFDALGDVLLAAKLFYERSGTRPHWEIVSAVADFLSEHWREPDFGIWEERETRHYTAGKVITACGLEFIAKCTKEPEEARRWKATARDIRSYIDTNCMTDEGAYAAVAGSQAVDVSAALFPIWSYTSADTPAMVATLAAIERDLGDNGLYRRHLELEDSANEGVFLAGTFWVAQYWIMRGQLDRARKIMDAALHYSNDLAFFSEEGDPVTGEMLGNFPQTFVHAAFIGAVLDLKTALERI